VIPRARLGRPRQCPDEVVYLVVTMRRGGALLREIADAMNRAGRPTADGRPHWRPAHVWNLLQTWGARQLDAQLDAQLDDEASLALCR
jgi:hypothetical protein